jgi:hypothetical protein
MTNDAKRQAWGRLCTQLEPLGIDPYAPQVPSDDPRYSQVQAALVEYKVAIGEVVPVPPLWEGCRPLRAITDLASLDDWLQEQWNSTLATEMGGERYKADAFAQATRAVRNGFRALAWLGVEDRPERPLPAETLQVAKQQLAALEGWVLQGVKDGWTPSKERHPPKGGINSATTQKRRNRSEFPDKYEINLLVGRYLEQHPDAPIRDVVAAVSLSQGTVQQSEAWRHEMARRKAGKPPPKIKERPLTRAMLAARGQKDDTATKQVMQDQAIWRWLLETAQPHERVDLHVKSPKERAELIDLSREAFLEAHEEPDD